MLAYQKTLQAMEMTSKQQQEFSNRTIRDLQEQLSRLSIESSQQEQLAQMVRNERDRLVREQQAKVCTHCTIIVSIPVCIASAQVCTHAPYYGMIMTAFRIGKIFLVAEIQVLFPITSVFCMLRIIYVTTQFSLPSFLMPKSILKMDAVMKVFTFTSC